jgi:hypothetical protein
MPKPKAIHSPELIELIGNLIGAFALGFALFFLIGVFIGLGRIIR